MPAEIPQRLFSAIRPEARPRMRPLVIAPQLTLRRLTPDDLDAVFEAASASRHEIARWLPWCHADYRREETAEYLGSQPAAWENREEFSYGIIQTDSGRFLGGCGINHIDWLHLRANLGYWVRHDATSRGVASAAARVLARAALEDLGLERIEIWVAVENTASRRVAEKAGAQLEGLSRCRLRMRDHQQDAAGYALVRADFGLSPRDGC